LTYLLLGERSRDEYVNSQYSNEELYLRSNVSRWVIRLQYYIVNVLNAQRTEKVSF